MNLGVAVLLVTCPKITETQLSQDAIEMVSIAPGSLRRFEKIWS